MAAKRKKKQEDFEEQSEVLRAIANPARIQMLNGLRKDECNVSKIEKTLGLPQSTVSHHLSILRSRGIIKGRREGTKMCYRIIDERVLNILDAIAAD